MKLQFIEKNYCSNEGIPQDEIDFKILIGIEYLVKNPDRIITGFSGENYMVFIKNTINNEFIVDVFNDGEKYRLIYSVLPEIGSVVTHSEMNILGEVIAVDYENDEVTVDWEKLPQEWEIGNPPSKISIHLVRTKY